MEPLTISSLALAGLGWVSGNAVASTLGNSSDRLFCETIRGVRDRLAGFQDLQANHEVARAVRIAQMQALEKSLREYQRFILPGSLSVPDLFFERSLRFCARTVGRCWRIRVQFNFDLIQPLIVAFDNLSSGPLVGTSPRNRSDRLAEIAESAVLNELAAELEEMDVPVGFEDHFRRGSGACPRFLEIFGACIAHQLKTNPAFRSLLVMDKLIGLQAATRVPARVL